MSTTENPFTTKFTSTTESRFINNTYVEHHEHGDYTTFYAAITICSVIGGLLFILNIVFCWCSQHRQYWQDRHTGKIQKLYTCMVSSDNVFDFFFNCQNGNTVICTYQLLQYFIENLIFVLC